MKTQDIFRKAGAILSEINEQYDYLASAAENLNDLELELLSANADFFAEHIRVLKKVNAAAINNAAAMVAAPKSEEYIVPVAEQYSKPEIVEPDTEPVAESLSPAAELATDEELMSEKKADSYFSFFPEEEQIEAAREEQAAVVQQLSLPEENPEPEPPIYSQETIFIAPPPVIAPEVEIEPVSAASGNVLEKTTPVAENEKAEDEKEEIIAMSDLLAASEPPKAPTLNELIAAQLSHNNAADNGFNKKPAAAVADLKSIINLNDKLTFIKDLFNGYSLAYSEAIEILNRFDSFDAADNFLKTNYAAKNNWALKQPTVDKFYELLNRRFVN